MIFADLIIKKDGLIKGPFGGDVKKSLFVKKGKDTYKVYEQGTVLEKNFNHGNYYISKEYFREKLKRFEVLENDLLMTGAGTLGEIITVPKNVEKGIINQALLRIRLNKDVINEIFFKYYFKYYIKEIILKINGDSVIPNLPPLPLIKNTEVNIPELAEQKKISDILSTLDQKIENNKKFLTEIENQIKLIYNYWFNQFEFPDFQDKPYTSSGNRLKWNKKIKRNIPTDWHVEKISELMEINKSGDWGKEKKEGNYSRKVICIRGADIDALNGKNILIPQIRYILEKNSSKILKQNDIIIEISGGSPIQSTGRIAYLSEFTFERFGTPIICSNFCRPIKVKNGKLFYYFIYWWKNLFDSDVFFNYEGQTSGIKNLLFEDFIQNNYLIIPNNEILDKFNHLISNLEKQRQKIIKEIDNLDKVRNWLLPLLMSKKLKVK